MTTPGPLRVALVGSHGTGKTTLLSALADHAIRRDVDLVALPETPRDVCRRAEDPEFFRRGRNAPLKQALLLIRHLILESEARESGADVLLMDRSLLDYWVYTQTLFGAELVESEIHDLLEDVVLEHCRRYDLLLFVPVEFPPHDDGVREADRDFQQSISDAIEGRLDVIARPVTVVRGSVEQRVETAWAAIESGLGGHGRRRES